MSDAWNLGDGLENVCRSVLRKAHYASYQTEEKPRTIINLDAYEITALIWAMDEYIRKGANDDRNRLSRHRQKHIGSKEFQIHRP